jgi:hypothetical protein
MRIEDKLKKLRPSMTNTIFKDMTVNKRNLKRKILLQSKSKPYSLIKLNFQQFMRVSLSILGVIILCVYIGVIGFTDLLPNQPMESQMIVKSITSSKDSNEALNIDKNKNVEIIQEKLNRSIVYPDKYAIANKMYRSLNYIENAQGMYKWGWGDPQSDDARKIIFYVDLVKKQNLIKTISKDSGTFSSLIKNGISINHKEDVHVFMVENIKPNYWDLIQGASFILKPEWYSILYNNYENWTYKKDTAFGIPVYRIQGEFNGEPFDMTVTQDTGILLNLRIYHRNIDDFYIVVDDIKINQGFQNEDEIFHLDLSSSKEISEEEFKNMISKDSK